MWLWYFSWLLAYYWWIVVTRCPTSLSILVNLINYYFISPQVSLWRVIIYFSNFNSNKFWFVIIASRNLDSCTWSEENLVLVVFANFTNELCCKQKGCFPVDVLFRIRKQKYGSPKMLIDNKVVYVLGNLKCSLWIWSLLIYSFSLFCFMRHTGFVLGG